ncbi:transaldolase, partial [bacterium]
MSVNPLQELARLGQSIWYDNVQRSMLLDGTLGRLIAEDAISGMTSNPSIFMKSIREGVEYQADIQRLAAQGLNAEQIYEALAVQDIQQAADTLRPVFDASDGADGFISLEVSPLIADDPQRTVSEALRIAALVNRPNLMVKVPATPAGIQAIAPLIAAGININATLLFAVEAYDKVMEAYLAGLEARGSTSLKAGSASVASFFISR